MVITTSYIADLHIHSLYSRATSKASNLHGLAAWAAIKGINVVGTGDFTHPGWFAHLTENLEPAEPGFFRLKHPPSFEKLTPILPPGLQPDTSGIRFVLSSEISSIYKRGGKVRKVHNILYAPDFKSVRKINTTLAGIGNLESDGRPILGLDSKILLEILLENAPQGFLVPAHIWTPWFSLFGSKSGFDAIEECFGDLSEHIFALETGLSSDPEMNRCISALDRFSLISNSDCHSPSKLGRESNVFTTGFDFFSMQKAIRDPVDKYGHQNFTATIEFYPEEGKYHCDGHRKCGVCLEPAQTVKEKGICPQCGRPLTIGVLYRVMELADRSTPVYPEGSPAVHSLVPLPELLGELFDCGAATKKVAGVYGKLINEFDSEFNLLLHTPIPDIKSASPMLAEAIDRIRKNRVIRKPGFDGEFGVIKVFRDEERAGFGGQLSLFGVTPAQPRKKKGKKTQVRIKQTTRKASCRLKKLNPEQQAAVDSTAARIIVKAGPGTGKTHTLVQRVNRLLAQQQSPITVITFTNKAADEIRQRLAKMGSSNQPVRVDTFHGYCLHWLRRHDPDLRVAGPEMRSRMFKRVYPQIKNVQRKKLQREAALFLSAQPRLPKTFPKSLQPFFESLKQHNLLDLDEIIPACTALIDHDPSFAGVVRTATGHLLVDEFQDLNAGQYELVRLLAKSCSIFAIGDPDQAIYGFRGASPAWFYRFIEEQKPELHSLVTNYRSGSIILEAASRVIAANHVLENSRITVAACNSRGVIYHHLAADPGAEARFIADQVQLLIGGTSHREIDRLDSSGGKGLALSDIAILYRTGRQAAVIAEGLAKRSIPCQVVDIQPFYQTGDAKIIYFWILLAAGMIDKAELLFLLGLEQEIGTQTLSDIEQLLPENSSMSLADLSECAGLLPAVDRKIIDKFTKLGAQYVQAADKESIVACIDLLRHRYSMDMDNPDLLRIGQLATSADSLKSFADHLRRYQDTVIYDERAEAVLLVTLHASKGLEFKAVFLVGCEEGLLPLLLRTHLTPEVDKEHLQEERRLFFVGMTRAARVLYLSGAAERRAFELCKKRTPSRFLAEIPVKLLSSPPVWSMKRRKKTSAKQLRLF